MILHFSSPPTCSCWDGGSECAGAATHHKGLPHTTLSPQHTPTHPSTSPPSPSPYMLIFPYSNVIRSKVVMIGCMKVVCFGVYIVMLFNEGWQCVTSRVEVERREEILSARRERHNFVCEDWNSCPGDRRLSTHKLHISLTLTPLCNLWPPITLLRHVTPIYV